MKLRCLKNIFLINLPTLPLKVLTNHQNTIPTVKGLPTAAALLHHVIAVGHHVIIAVLAATIDKILETYQRTLKNSQMVLALRLVK